MLRLVLSAAATLAVAVPAMAARPVVVASGTALAVTTAAGSVPLPAVPGLAIDNLVGSAERWVAAGSVEGGGFAVFAGDAVRARRLPAPPVAGASLHQEPLPLLDDRGRLAGLAWLEGSTPRGLAVRFARWDGARWERPRTVSAPGPGSQLALAATALADGTLLLAWSAFDGVDDEVMWSAWDGGAWSPPARLAADNAVPDITPALTAVDGAAVAAWATFAGEGYRVVVSRFAAGSWSLPRVVGPAGSVFPSFEPATLGPRLLVRTALPRGWMVVDLDGDDARPLRHAFAAAAAAERPVVEDAGGSVTLSWPGRELPPGAASWQDNPARSRR